MYIKMQPPPGIPDTARNLSSPVLPEKQSEQRFSKLPEQDTVSFSSNQSEKTEWEMAVRDTILNLQQKFSNINIIVSADMCKDSTARAASGLGEGLHVILSRSFLERMGSCREEYEKCKLYLTNTLAMLSENTGNVSGTGAYIDENGVTFWQATHKENNDSLTPNNARLKIMQEQLDRLKSDLKAKTPSYENKFRFKVSNPYAMMDAYAKLAGAGTKGQVRAVMGEVQRKIASLRMVAANQEDSKQQAQARAAIASCNNLLLRGGRKIRRLDEEAIARLREKQAQRMQNDKRKQQLRLEINRMRAARRSADMSIASEGMLSDLNNYVRFHSYDYYEDKFKEITGAASTPEQQLQSAATPPGAAAGGINTGSDAVNVTVTQTISF